MVHRSWLKVGLIEEDRRTFGIPEAYNIFAG